MCSASIKKMVSILVYIGHVFSLCHAKDDIIYVHKFAADIHTYKIIIQRS